MVGTLFNTFAVAVGASAGLALGARWSSELKDKMFVVLGLFTLAIGSMMALETAQPIDLFLALVFEPSLATACNSKRVFPDLPNRRTAPRRVAALWKP